MTEDSHNTNRNTFVPAFLKLRKHQYLVSFAFMLIFALIGLMVSFLVSPKYEAEAVLITNLELVQDANVTEVMVDSQLELVGQLMYHPDIVEEVLILEEAAGNPITLEILKENSTLERRLMSNVVKVRDADPTTAARIASNWVQIAYDRLSEAYESALQVSEAQWTITMIEGCQTDPQVIETNFCQNLTPDEVGSLTNEAQAVILSEGPYALGLTKELQISQYQPAIIPGEPIQGARANLMLAGALIGLFFSLIIYEMPGFSKECPED